MAAVELLEITSRLSAQLCDKSDLTQTQWTALRFFSDQSTNATIGEFAEFFRVSPSSASQTLSRLRDRKLVVYVRPETDRRRCEVELTPAGQEKLENDPALQLMERLLRLEQDQFDGLVQGLTGLITDDAKMFD